MEMKNTYILKQDNALFHTAKLVHEWVKNTNNQVNFSILSNWSGNSPDLKPIENCWAKLKKLMAKKTCNYYQ